MPTTRQAKTRSSIGNRIQCGGSCGSRGKFTGGGPKKTVWMKRIGIGDGERAGDGGDIGCRTCRAGKSAWVSTASAKNISFERKPLSSGTPAIAALATIASVAVIGR